MIRRLKSLGVLTAVLLLSVLIGANTSWALSWATAGGQQPLYYIPVTLTNNQAGTTAANLQVGVTINSNINSAKYASALKNVNWQDGAGNILNSWLESGESNSSIASLYWVNLGSNTISGSGATLTIYEAIYGTSIAAIDGTDTGAEPLWAGGTYGQYDNGTTVFPFYDNFAGSSLAGSWTAPSGNFGLVVNNGVNLNPPAALGDDGYYNTATAPAPAILDTQMSESSGSGSPGNTSYIGTSPGTDYFGATGTTQIFGENISAGSYFGVWADSSGHQGGTPVLNNTYIVTGVMTNPALVQVNYNSIAAEAGTKLTAGNNIGFASAGTGATLFQWLRRRLFPPSGVAPSSSNGVTISVAGPTPTSTPTPAPTHIKFFSGFETGDTSEWTGTGSGSPVIATDQTGFGISGYALKSNPTTVAYVTSPTFSALTTSYVRFNFYTTASDDGTSVAPRAIYVIGSGTVYEYFYVNTNHGSVQLLLYDQNFTQIGSNVNVSSNTWHTVELKRIASATVGVLEMKLDGSVVATASSHNTGTAGIDTLSFGVTASNSPHATGNWWFDDIAITDAGYLGYGYTIARQGTSGSPTYNQWTCNDGGVANAWSETPFSATNNCNTTIPYIGLQSMVMASFGAAGNAQEGSGIVYSPYQLNAAKTFINAKYGYNTGSGTLSILDRLSAVDSLTPITMSGATANTGYTTAPYGVNYSQLVDPASEIGVQNTDPAYQSANGVTANQVNDMWEMVDYQPTATATATPTATPTPIPATPTATATATPIATPTPQASGCLPGLHLGWKAGLEARTPGC